MKINDISEGRLISTNNKSIVYKILKHNPPTKIYHGYTELENIETGYKTTATWTDTFWEEIKKAG